RGRVQVVDEPLRVVMELVQLARAVTLGQDHHIPARARRPVVNNLCLPDHRPVRGTHRPSLRARDAPRRGTLRSSSAGSPDRPGSNGLLNRTTVLASGRSGTTRANVPSGLASGRHSIGSSSFSGKTSTSKRTG